MTTLLHMEIQMSEWCCWRSIEQFFIYRMRSTICIWTRWLWCQVCTRPTWLDFYSASSLKQQSLGRTFTPLWVWHITLILSQVVFALTPWCCMLRGVAATNFIIFSLMQPGLEPMIYHTRGKHTNPIWVFLWPDRGLNPWSTTTHETSTLTQFYGLSDPTRAWTHDLPHTRQAH